MIFEDVKRWLIKALEDLRIAKHELSFPEEEIATGPLCFHCQQAVEKLLKAFLVSRGIDFGRTHNLEYLLNLCINQDPEFAQLNVGNLTSYAVGIRYVDDFYIPSIDEAREAFDIALKIKNFIFYKLDINENEIRGNI